MGADGEAVRLVAQALQVVEHRVARFEPERRPAGDEEPLAPCLPVQPLGDGHERDFPGKAQFLQHL